MPYKVIVSAMKKIDSGLEIRDRLWLKITIPNAFIGSDLVNWIMENVDGINDRREARKFIGNMLRKNFIKHTVNKLTFSENSYYQFGEGDLGGCLLNDDDGESEQIEILSRKLYGHYRQMSIKTGAVIDMTKYLCNIKKKSEQRKIPYILSR